MKKIIITLAALAAVSGSAIAREKSDSEAMIRAQFNSAATVEQAPFAVSGATTVKDIDVINDERRGDSSGGNNN
jgi:hypothetical protein